MKIKFFGVTFWFNVFDDHNDILSLLQKNFEDEYKNFNINNSSNNLLEPVIVTTNSDKKTNLAMSKINLQYTAENCLFSNFSEFKEKCLMIFNILSEYGIKVLHSSVCINGEIITDDALLKSINKTLSKDLINEDIVDVNLKISKKEEDLFYKIISIFNKKQIKLPKINDELGRNIPLPLISWNGALTECEMIDISYELNDKYSFDFTKNYQTTEFHLNKMLYLLENNFKTDLDEILEDVEF